MGNVLQWLEETAQRLPDKTAVAGPEDALSYGSLLDASKRAGTFLAGRTAPGQPVAFLLEKSPAALAGMLGAVWARGIYCVLDPRQSTARLASMLQTLRPSALVCDQESAQLAQKVLDACPGLGGPEEPVLAVDLHDLFGGVADEALLARLRSQALDTDPLYISFTSGFTGTPKGVVVSHRCVTDFIGHYTALFGIGEDDRLANQAPFDFDVSVKDIYSALLTGATMHLVPRAYFSVPVQLMDYLVERQVTVCTWAVSALCFVSTMRGFEYKVPTTIRKVLFSGEVMPAKHLRAWRQALPQALFVNLYGPTEVTCNCTYHIVEGDLADDETLPAGVPFPNEKVFLVDDAGRLVDGPGAEGEICVGGATIALGYYGAPERTAKAFVQNPLHNEYPEVVYRTGDYGAWSEEGNLLYRGRRDNQIKHLGQRIELGEIEVAAQGCPGVSRACCFYDARKKKIVLVVAGSAGKGDVAAWLREKLPGYMVPGKVVEVDAMPLNKNGKVDRGALAQAAGITR